MRQVIYAAVFEGPDGVTLTARMKAKMLQPAPSPCYVIPAEPVVRQDFCAVGQSIAALGKQTDSEDGEDPSQRGISKAQGQSQPAVKGLVKVIWKQM